MPTVVLENVSTFFGRIKALEDINLRVENGEYLALLGPSGCGKTTLINAITGIVNPTKGQVYIDDRPVNGVPIEARDFAMVFQSIALFPHMTVEENVAYGPFVHDASKKEQDEASKDMLKLVDLLDQKKLKPRSLSGGAQQKTAVARALANKEKLLILDEPISALDYKVRVELRYELRRLVKDLGLTAIHITHDQEEAAAIADRIVVMRAGRIVEIGTPQQLYENPKNLFTMNFIGESNFLEGRIAEKINSIKYKIEFRNHKSLIAEIINHKFSEEDSIVVTIRPEMVKIYAQKRDNVLAGKIVQKRFIGGYTRYEVKLATEDNLIVDSRKRFELEDKVYIELESQKFRIFLAPEFGLRRVLALE